MSEPAANSAGIRTTKSMIKDVVMIGTGAASGQAIVMLFSPLLTRLYDVEAFGVFGMFSAIVASIGTLSSLRFEQAILIEKDDEGAGEVLRLCVSVVSAITLLSFVGFIIANFFPMRSIYGQLVPMLIEYGAANILVLGVFSGLYGWFTRAGSFRTLGIYQFSRSAIGVALQLIFCLFGHDARFLIAGQTVGLVAALLLIVGVGRPRTLPVLLARYRLDALSVMARRYKTFPLYGAPQTLVRMLSQNMPALLLPIFFGAAQSGLFWLAYRILILPSQIVVESTRGVLFRDLGALHRNGADLRRAMARPALYLGALSGSVAILLFFFGPFLFGLVFGSHWQESGRYAAILSVAWTVENAGMPAAVVISLLELQRVYLAVEILSLIARVVALYIGSRFHSAELGIELYVVASVAASAANMSYVWWVLSRRSRRVP